MSDGLVKILDGNTFVVSDDRGDIEASPTDPTGLFSFDTRFLSRWVLTLNGERMNALSTDDLQYFETRFFLVPGTGTVYIDAKLSVIRQRAVGAGFEEELTILNHDAKPVSLTVRIEAASDFADLFEVKDALEKKGTYSTRVRNGSLELGYERETFKRADDDLRLDSRDGRQGRPDATGSDRAARELVDPAHVSPHGLPRVPGGTRAPGGTCSRDLEKWLDAAPRLECDSDSLKTTYRRSLVDLAALRFSPPIAGGHSLPAAGLPVVHDDVRARQHLHEPSGAAVRAGARGDDAAGARRVAGEQASTTSATRIPAGSSTRCATAR